MKNYKNIKNKKLKNKINDLLEIPKEISENLSKMIILGFDSIRIENCIGIMEYFEEFILVKVNMGLIYIYGNKLNLIKMKEDEIKIEGVIDKIEFTSKEGD